MKSKTLTIFVDSSPEAVHKFTSNPENMPKWAKAFCKSIKKAEGGWWAMTTPMGPAKVRFETEAKYGILDHVVEPAPGVQIHVPMRVVANGKGSEIIFTLFQMPGMDDKRFAQDLGMVEQDLQSLKKCVEEGK